MREKTPIDIYRESKIPTIYIEMSRNFRAANSYSLVVNGLARQFNFSKLTRDNALAILDSVHSMYHREYNIIYTNLHTRTIIKDIMLYHIDEDNNYERERNNMINASKRDMQRFGKTPTTRVKGFKRPNPKTIHPIEKTW